ncbi:FtsK/SpoIIIE domain-containing protein [Streptomyces chumphonensis]|uniref:FtsK/SpoIIIE domain-containing protein n=1 Tax=Streptomyces chumphonensis TaxID=1214925 RepID=UPI003D703B4A
MSARRRTAAVPAAAGAEVVPVRRGDVGGYLIGKALPYASPWLGAAALPPLAGWATNSMWADTATSAGLASAGIAVAGAALTSVTWKTAGGSNKFRQFRRVQATASVAAGMGWLTAATAAGPFGSPLLDLWLIGGGLFAASWNIRQLMRNAHDETETETGGGLGALAEAIGWEKTRVRGAKGNGKGSVSAELEVTPGTDVAAVQGTTSKLAAALHVPPSGVTVTPDPEDAGRATLALRVADLLKDGVQYALPSALGLLPTEPIPVGLYADGEPWTVNPFDAAILQHLMVMGVTGSGKSEFARDLLAHLMCRRQISLFLVDVAKGRQTVGHIKDGLDWLVTDPKEAKRLVNSLPAAIKARGDRLADEGLDEWTPASSLNAMVVWLEEAADLVDFEKLEKIARAARSVGIWLVISLQRATWSNMSTDVRANLQATACFGVDSAGDASFCLPDSVTDAGAVPVWGSDRPGYGFATGMGIPQPRWTMEVRSALTDREVLSALVQAAAVVRDPLDETTAAALGQAYAQRAHRGTNRTTVPASDVEAVYGRFPLPIADGAPVAAGAAPDSGPVRSGPVPLASARPAVASGDQEHDADHDHDQDDDAEELDRMDWELEAVYEEVMGAIPGDPEPDAAYAHLGLEDDVPDADPDSGIAFEAQERPSTEEARHILYAELDGWMSGGRLEFEPADLIPAVTAAGRKRPWMQGELKRLVQEGVLRKDGHGSYTILQSPLQPA